MSRLAQICAWCFLLLAGVAVVFAFAKIRFSEPKEKPALRDGVPVEKVVQSDSNSTLDLDELEPGKQDEMLRGQEEFLDLGKETSVVWSREDVRVDLDLLSATAWQLLQKHQGLLVAREEFRATGGDIDDLSDVGRTKAEALSESKRIFDEGMEFGLIILELEGEVQELNEIYREILLRLVTVDEDTLSDVLAAKTRAWSGLDFKSRALDLVKTHFNRLEQDYQIDLDRITKDYENEAKELSKSM